MKKVSGPTLASVGPACWAPVLVVLLAIATPASTEARDTWKIDAENSEIKFVARKFKESFEGSFKSFKVYIAFDPETPGSGRIKAEIDIGSIRTGIEKVDEILKKPEWFATDSHPIAVFEASGFNKIGKNKYAIEGTITLKGKTEKMVLEANVVVEDDPVDTGRLVAKASSEITIKRLVFLIGTGPWADIGALADEVKVLLKVAASRPK